MLMTTKTPDKEGLYLFARYKDVHKELLYVYKNKFNDLVFELPDEWGYGCTCDYRTVDSQLGFWGFLDIPNLEELSSKLPEEEGFYYYSPAEKTKTYKAITVVELELVYKEGEWILCLADAEETEKTDVAELGGYWKKIDIEWEGEDDG